MKRYYFETKDCEICYDKSHFDDIMEYEGITEIEVYEAIPKILGGGIFWCNEHLFCGDNSSETCGKYNCNEYEPLNKKNGRCKFYNIWLHIRGNEIVLHLNKNKQLKTKKQ